MPQGKFISGASTSSEIDGDAFGTALRPGIYGTLTAADAVSRGDLFQLPGGVRGVPNGVSGVINLPRYHPKYKSFKNSTNSKSGTGRDSQLTPLHGDDSPGGPVYAKPRKNRPAVDRYADQQQQQQHGGGTREDINHTFTVVDGFDAESQSERQQKDRRKRIIIILAAALLAVAVVAVMSFAAVYFSK